VLNTSSTLLTPMCVCFRDGGAWHVCVEDLCLQTCATVTVIGDWWGTGTVFGTGLTMLNTNMDSSSTNGPTLAVVSKFRQLYLVTGSSPLQTNTWPTFNVRLMTDQLSFRLPSREGTQHN
jgi:hypothetical protein